MVNIIDKTFMLKLALWTCLIGVALSWSLSKDSNELSKQLNTETKHGGVHWALVIAGSSGYFNYRHQVCIIHHYLHKIDNNQGKSATL